MIEGTDLRDLVGKTLLAQGGVRIGRVGAVYAAPDGTGTFAAVRTGLLGTATSFVPLADAEVHGTDVHVPYDKQRIDAAPVVADEEELSADEEERLHAHYGLVGRPAVTAPTEGAVVTRSEERLLVGTERVETGRARLRKYVVTETETRTVPVTHEELRVVREPVTPGTPGLPQVDALSEEVHEVVLSAERPRVEREVVPVERIRLSTETVTGEVTVSEPVRKEQVEVLSDLPLDEPYPVDAAPETETHTELFVAPREGDAGEGATSEFFLAPREDER